MDLDFLLKKLKNTRTTDQLKSYCEQFIEKYSCDYYSLYGSIFTTLLAPPLYKIGSPNNKKLNDSKQTTRILQTCIESVTPVIAGNISDIKIINKSQINTIHIANSRKLDIYFPVHFPHGKFAIFHISMRTKKQDMEKTALSILPTGRQFANEAGLAFISLLENELDYAHPILTERERTCLLFTADGYTPKDIAEKFGLSQHTVNFYLKNARKKYSAKNIYGVISKAIISGEIKSLIGLRKA